MAQKTVTRADLAEAVYAGAKVWVWGLLLVAVTMTVVLALALTRSIVRPLGQSLQVAETVAKAEQAGREGGWFGRNLRRLASVGKPLLLGLAIFATSAGVLSYLLVSGLWHLRVRLQRRRRLRHRAAGR